MRDWYWNRADPSFSIPVPPNGCKGASFGAYCHTNNGPARLASCLGRPLAGPLPLDVKAASFWSSPKAPSPQLHTCPCGFTTPYPIELIGGEPYRCGQCRALAGVFS